jgi:hypothetical protein
MILALATRRSRWRSFPTVGTVDWPALYVPVLLAVAPWPSRTHARAASWRSRRYAVVLFVGIASWLLTRDRSAPSVIVLSFRGTTAGFRSRGGFRVS